MDLELAGKTAIITGGSGGIGRGLVLGFAGEGCNVVVATRDAKKGQEVAHGEEVGLLGNSGRSTGAHVHYEILVDGKPKDPARFVMAGRNAFKE